MHERYSWSWLQKQVSQTAGIWQACDSRSSPGVVIYCKKDQQLREKAYDQALREVEREARHATKSGSDRLTTQNRVTASFARFSASALGLSEEAIDLLTNDFLPVGTKLARWARHFDPTLSMPGIVQACRNAWTACGMQPLLGDSLELTPAILGYSMLYPYSDNYLDREDLSAATKLYFSHRFLQRLRGEEIAAENHHETSVWAMVELIERQYPRHEYPQVFDCLYAIHRAQEESIAQLRSQELCDEADILKVSCAKGGSSVLTDACLSHGWLSKEESRFAFEWGVLLQLGDDLQDVQDDLRRGSITLFTRAVTQGMPLDQLVHRLLNFSQQVGNRMDCLSNGSAMLKDLLRMSWRSLIVGAVANSYQFCSESFLQEMEQRSPFRFDFLRERNKRLTKKQGLFATLFDAFLDEPAIAPNCVPAKLVDRPEETAYL